jgi:hypothetical protein
MAIWGQTPPEVCCDDWLLFQIPAGPHREAAIVCLGLCSAVISLSISISKVNKPVEEGISVSSWWHLKPTHRL